MRPPPVQAQFITGLISAIICAFIFTAGCLVFRFRYREPKQGELPLPGILFRFRYREPEQGELLLPISLDSGIESQSKVSCHCLVFRFRYREPKQGELPLPGFSIMVSRAKAW